ncbi:MAG: formate-dependent phosphoribosylglycinamide formyltransferase, partial [Endozoicomonas sp.]
LGKELAIECKLLGCEVIACDHYPNAPAMQIADRAYHFSMLDKTALQEVIQKEQPDFVVPEVEAIATDLLVNLEQQGLNVVPTAKAVELTMNREGIRRLASEKLGLPTSSYTFCDTLEELQQAVAHIGTPCVIKPVMSSSGKGQSVIKNDNDIQAAWEHAQEGGRAGKGRVIVEDFITFDIEITLLTIRHISGTIFCEPIGHRQEDGDYQESWQPQTMTKKARALSQDIARKITDELGGRGLFGVELFIKDDDVIFSEVSPRPHDTGMVTLISQNLSEFALHARAFLGLPIPSLHQYGAAASKAILVEGDSSQVAFTNLNHALSLPDTEIRLFGKPQVSGKRRMGVALALGKTIEDAVEKTIEVSNRIHYEC